MLLRIADSIADRPETTAEARSKLGNEVIESVLSFEPRDASEIMLAGMAVTQFYLMLDATHDVWFASMIDAKVRTRSGIVGIGRTMSTLLKELRTAQIRPGPEIEPAVKDEIPTQPADAHVAAEANPPVPPAPAVEPCATIADRTPDVADERDEPEQNFETDADLPRPFKPAMPTSAADLPAFMKALKAMSSGERGSARELAAAGTD